VSRGGLDQTGLAEARGPSDGPMQTSMLEDETAAEKSYEQRLDDELRNLD
jgi:hypothetical protein